MDHDRFKPSRQPSFSHEVLPKVLVIYTGGTIGMVNSHQGYIPKTGYLPSILETSPVFHDPSFVVPTSPFFTPALSPSLSLPTSPSPTFPSPPYPAPPPSSSPFYPPPSFSSSPPPLSSSCSSIPSSFVPPPSSSSSFGLTPSTSSPSPPTPIANKNVRAPPSRRRSANLQQLASSVPLGGFSSPPTPLRRSPSPPPISSLSMSEESSITHKMLVTPPSQFGKRIQYQVLEYKPLLDSCNLDMKDWGRIAEDIGKRYTQFDAFVVLHGTDTMAYTASALSFLLENLGKTVIITGSQIPMAEQRNDGFSNFLGALTIAGHFTIPEVLLYFNNQAFRGCRASKVSASEFHAFSSPNLPPLVEVGVSIDVHWDKIFPPYSATKFEVCTKMEENVAVLRFFPGITVTTLESFLGYPIRGVVLQTYGAGNGPDTRRDLIDCLARACKRGVIIFNTTQCLKGYVTDAYATGRVLKEAGVIPGGDMTPEAALTKLAYVLAKIEWSLEKKKKMLENNLRGERHVIHSSHRFEFGDQSFVEKLSRSLGAVGREMQQFKSAVYPILLCKAAAEGNVEEMNLLVKEGAPISAQDYEGRSALHQACLYGHPEAVNFLLKHGGLVHQADNFGNNALSNAIRGRHLEIVHLVRKVGGSLPSSYHLAGRLCDLASSNDIEMMKVHIAAGVDLNMSNFDNRTPLMCAASYNHIEMVHLLCQEESVDVDLVDLFGNTAMSYALQNNSQAIMTILEDKFNKDERN